MTGVAVVTPVEALTPGLVTVSRETAPPGLLLDVLERLQSHNFVLLLTKVVFMRFLLLTFIRMTFRHLGNRLQPSRDVHPLNQRNLPVTLHPRQSPSVAHSDWQRSLWRSVSRDLQLLSGADRDWGGLEAVLYCLN